MPDQNPPIIANGKICYVEIPSRDINESSSFYRKIFNWEIRTRGDGSVAFNDTTGQVSGTWKLLRPSHRDVGLLVYIMVDDIELTIQAIIENGGKIVQPVGLDAPEITARFSDPSGNIFGIFQQ